MPETVYDALIEENVVTDGQIAETLFFGVGNAPRTGGRVGLARPAGCAIQQRQHTHRNRTRKKGTAFEVESGRLCGHGLDSFDRSLPIIARTEYGSERLRFLVSDFWSFEA